MDEFKRKRFDNLLGQAKDPALHAVAREHIHRAFGYIDGLYEGDAINAVEYSGLFTEIMQAEAVIYERTRAQGGLALLAS